MVDYRQFMDKLIWLVAWEPGNRLSHPSACRTLQRRDMLAAATAGLAGAAKFDDDQTYLARMAVP